MMIRGWWWWLPLIGILFNESRSSAFLWQSLSINDFMHELMVYFYSPWDYAINNTHCCEPTHVSIVWWVVERLGMWNWSCFCAALLGHWINTKKCSNMYISMEIVDWNKLNHSASEWMVWLVRRWMNRNGIHSRGWVWEGRMVRRLVIIGQLPAQTILLEIDWTVELFTKKRAQAVMDSFNTRRFSVKVGEDLLFSASKNNDVRYAKCNCGPTRRRRLRQVSIIVRPRPVRLYSHVGNCSSSIWISNLVEGSKEDEWRTIVDFLPAIEQTICILRAKER